MSVTIRFHRSMPWALEPRKLLVDRPRARSDAATYRDSFRFLRAERRPEHCAPWVMGQELGWRIHSPIDITFTPLVQTEVATESEPQDIARVTGQAEVWGRERSQLAVDRTRWLHFYQFKTGDTWENMFLPNGQGTVEWRLGWRAEIPRGYFLLITASEHSPAGLEVPTGILSSTVAERMGKESGASIAVRPTTTVEIRRGQEIARAVLLHAESLQATAAYPSQESDDDA